MMRINHCNDWALLFKIPELMLIVISFLSPENWQNVAYISKNINKITQNYFKSQLNVVYKNKDWEKAWQIFYCLLKIRVHSYFSMTFLV